ncbi:hypothetical protein HAX54_010118 [Datura stramonium]|uniref:Uncharacterized protein n=1 Tax=Datura stramonium TaxID=4076 RepID=A0ABS8TIK4_DATST|nr:hypothetical protein [Datura stramonium]
MDALGKSQLAKDQDWQNGITPRLKPNNCDVPLRLTNIVEPPATSQFVNLGRDINAREHDCGSSNEMKDAFEEFDMFQSLLESNACKTQLDLYLEEVNLDHKTNLPLKLHLARAVMSLESFEVLFFPQMLRQNCVLEIGFVDKKEEEDYDCRRKN